MNLKDIRTTRMQYEKLVDLLETAPDIARGLFKGDQTPFWNEVTENLNALGPPIIPNTVWKKLWFDYKCAVKKKLRDNKASMIATGGGPCRLKPLNEIEERVANLTNLGASVEGNSVQPLGLWNKENVTTENNDYISSTIHQRRQQPPPQIPLPQEHTELVQIEQNEQLIPASLTMTRVNRKRMRKNIEDVLLQNKEMIDELKKNTANQEKIIKLQEETNDTLKQILEVMKLSCTNKE